MPHDKSKQSYSNRPLPESKPNKKRPADYLLRAQELQAYTIDKCADIQKNPDRGGKSLTFSLLNPMCETANRITQHCVYADENFPTCRQDWIDRRKDLRLAWQAAKDLDSLLTVAQLTKRWNVGESVIEEWSRKINRVLGILNKTIEDHETRLIYLLDVDYKSVRS